MAEELTGAPSALDVIVGIMILFCGTTIIIGGFGAIADRKQPQYVIGFCLLLFGCLVLAIGAKAMGWIS